MRNTGQTYIVTNLNNLFPPTCIIEHPDGGLIIERRDDHNVWELTLYKDGTIEYTIYEDGKVIFLKELKINE